VDTVEAPAVVVTWAAHDAWGRGTPSPWAYWKLDGTIQRPRGGNFPNESNNRRSHFNFGISPDSRAQFDSPPALIGRLPLEFSGRGADNSGWFHGAFCGLGLASSYASLGL
jgi:hypothetical protein